MIDKKNILPIYDIPRSYMSSRKINNNSLMKRNEINS
jgi:hypothetical protein